MNFLIYFPAPVVFLSSCHSPSFIEQTARCDNKPRAACVFARLFPHRRLAAGWAGPGCVVLFGFFQMREFSQARSSLALVKPKALSDYFTEKGSKIHMPDVYEEPRATPLPPLSFFLLCYGR